MKLVGSSREETRISSFNLRSQDKTFNFDTKPDKALILITAGIAYGYYAIMITTTTWLNIILTSKWNMHNKFILYYLFNHIRGCFY